MKGYNFQLKKSFPFEYKKATYDNLNSFYNDKFKQGKRKYIRLQAGSSPDHCAEGRHFRWSGPIRLNPELH